MAKGKNFLIMCVLAVLLGSNSYAGDSRSRKQSSKDIPAIQERISQEKPIYKDKKKERSDLWNIINELDEQYDFVSQEKKENERLIIFQPPCFMDYSNLPAFRIEEGLIKSVNWKSLYSPMTMEEFKNYVESIDRYKQQLIKGVSYIKN
jgi:hypothetical protein